MIPKTGLSGPGELAGLFAKQADGFKLTVSNNLDNTLNLGSGPG